MRRILPAMTVMAATALLAACGSSGGGGGAASATPSASAASCSNAAIQPDLYTRGVLTVGTDNPAFPPWFEHNNPANGKGYESAVAYAIATQLAFSNSYAPGQKKFDFDINEVSVTPQRATAVTFSSGYYDVDQALVALKNTPIVTKHSPADLKSYVFGDQIGTTSLAFINSEIQPTSRPKIFETLKIGRAHV